MSSAAGVCIVSGRYPPDKTSSLQSLVKASGFKLRQGSSLVPDLLLSRKGVTNAFVFLDVKAGMDCIDSEISRLRNVSTTFKHVTCLLPAGADNDPRIMDTCCRLRKVVRFVALSPTDDPAALTFDIDHARNTSEGSSQAIRKQWMQDVTCADAQDALLGAIPAEQPLTAANMSSLSVLGSISQLSACTAREMLESTCISEAQALDLEAFWSSAYRNQYDDRSSQDQGASRGA